MTRFDDPYQVAVIGAQPMGPFAAERLARPGIRTRRLEKDPVPGTSTVCGGGMHVEVPRYVSLPDDVIERQLNACRLIVNGKTRDWRFPTTQYVTVEAIRARSVPGRAGDDEAEVARINFAVALGQRGRFKEAIEVFQEAVEREPANATLHNNLGFALYHQGNLEAAIEHFQRTLQIDPGFAEARQALADARTRLRR